MDAADEPGSSETDVRDVNSVWSVSSLPSAEHPGLLINRLVCSDRSLTRCDNTGCSRFRLIDWRQNMVLCVYCSRKKYREYFLYVNKFLHVCLLTESVCINTDTVEDVLVIFHRCVLAERNLMMSLLKSVNICHIQLNECLSCKPVAGPTIAWQGKRLWNAQNPSRKWMQQLFKPKRNKVQFMSSIHTAEYQRCYWGYLWTGSLHWETLMLHCFSAIESLCTFYHLRPGVKVAR